MENLGARIQHDVQQGSPRSIEQLHLFGGSYDEELTRNDVECNAANPLTINEGIPRQMVQV